MDEELALRIRVFRDSGQAQPHVADFVAAELEALAAEGRPVGEDTAGMLTSHLMMALTRLLNGEALAEFPADAQISAELADHPAAVARARELAGRAAAQLGAALPESEIRFVALHLAVLDARPRHPAATDTKESP